MQPDRVELGLERILRVASHAGIDQPEFRILTVAGTNGKGSTVAYAASILRHMGKSVGVYTSPHFIDFNERIVIDDRRVSDASLCAAFAHIDDCRGETELTYFEFTTLAAMLCFAESAVDIAVLEVGLGGRLDAVNAWDSDAACITSIGIDHTDWLGHDRESIAREKVGVARRGCALVCGDYDPPAIIRSFATEIGAKPLFAGHDFSVSRDEDTWRYTGPQGRTQLPAPAIQAQWAIDNAAVAICLCGEVLGEMPTQSALQAAMKEVLIAGRMQHFEYRGLPLLLDVAHNAAAARLLADYLQQHQVDGQTCAVFSCMQDKDPGAVIEALAGTIDQWFIGQIDYPRAFDASELASLLKNESSADTKVFASVIQAFEAAVAQSGVGSRVVVFGSFHVVGPVLDMLKASQ